MSESAHNEPAAGASRVPLFTSGLALPGLEGYGLDARFEDLSALLDRDAILVAALRMLVGQGCDTAWYAAPGADNSLILDKVVNGRTGVLRGLVVPYGQGLTGRVYGDGRPSWVDDYFSARTITHRFDEQIAGEGIQRLLAVPLPASAGPGAGYGVLAVGARSPGLHGDRGMQHALRVAQRTVAALSLAERARRGQEIAVAEERRRIASELHDTVGALLFAIGSGMRELAGSLGEVDPDVTAKLRRLREQASAATTALRDSSRTLRSSPGALALGVALRADCDAFADRTGVPAQFLLLDEDPPELGPGRTEVVVAGVREALLNVEKHAGASAVVVTVGRVGPGLCVTVADDGTGVTTASAARWDDRDGGNGGNGRDGAARGHRDPDTYPPGTHPAPGPHSTPGLGLATTREAVERLGGTLTVASDPHGGTTWRLRLPWAPS